MKLKIKKGDTVFILKGKDRGKSGKILKVIPKERRVVVEGLNLYKKRIRPKRAGQKGEVVLLPRPMNVSNVALFCPNCKRGVRVGIRLDGEQKVRFCKKCGVSI